MFSRPMALSENARLAAILAAHQRFRSSVVPLCAAETPISDYVRSFLLDPIHERYAMGGPRVKTPENFIGSEFVLDLHQLTIELSQQIFAVQYADPRPHSGTGAITNLLMTLSSPGQTILLQTTDSGGHASMAPICRRLGLEILDFPYDYQRYNFDGAALRQLDAARVDFVLLAPSDIIYAPDLASMAFSPETTVIYDATQTLGLIASGHLSSPFTQSFHSKLVVCGGTHKTLPGPSSGIILTDHEGIATRLDTELSPKFIRHSHPHHIASLCATLIEQQAIGTRYADRIQSFSKVLTDELRQRDIRVLQHGERTSETHQVFIWAPQENLDSLYHRFGEIGVTLNKKAKRLFDGSGLRLGVQEIARYQWALENLVELADLIDDTIRERASTSLLRQRARDLAQLNTISPNLCLPA